MYPDLSYFFHDLFGTPVDNWSSLFKTFGIFLALVFVVSFFLIRSEIRRKHKEGLIPVLNIKVAASSPLKEAFFNAIFGFIMGLKIPYIYSNFDLFKKDPPSMIFSKDGNYVMGILLAVIFGMYTYFMVSNKPISKAGRMDVHPADKSGDIILIAALFGVLGSRLFSILENLDSFWADPFGQLFSGAGLTIYGGLILAFIAVFLYVKRIGIPPIHMMDIAALPLLIGYGIGRMGCQFSGDGDWGIVNENPKPDWFVFPDWAWAYDYPRNVADFHQTGIKIKDCVGNFCTHLDPPVFPTPLYEITFALIAFSFLWMFRRRFKTPGRLFFTYLILSSFARFWVESIRVNPRYDLFGLDWSQAQWISVALFVIGIIGFFLVGKGGSGSAFKRSKPDYTIPDIREGTAVT